MTALPIDGKALAETLRLDFATHVADLAARGHRPGLTVILVGDDAASQIYVRNKVAACEAVGIKSDKIVFPADVPQATLVETLATLNSDPTVHGILVQLPLPGHIDEAAVLAGISADRDVDGFHAENVGALAQGSPRFIPCTPYGVMKMLEHANVDLNGKEVVVLGRSNIVGKPMALLLLGKGATVTICHSRTRDLASHTRRADVLVCAVGRARMIRGDMIKPGAIVVDVGINRLPDGKLCGDADYESCAAVASRITPVPGGVGPMTITMLLANTIEAATRRAIAVDLPSTPQLHTS